MGPYIVTSKVPCPGGGDGISVLTAKVGLNTPDRDVTARFVRFEGQLDINTRLDREQDLPADVAEVARRCGYVYVRVEYTCGCDPTPKVFEQKVKGDVAMRMGCPSN